MSCVWWLHYKHEKLNLTRVFSNLTGILDYMNNTFLVIESKSYLSLFCFLVTFTEIRVKWARFIFVLIFLIISAGLCKTILM
jgi:hypothetical protein